MAEVSVLSTTLIVVLVFGALFCVGGPIIGHLATRHSEKSDK